MWKKISTIFLLLAIAFYKSSAQTNDISPGLRKQMKEANDRLQFYLTNECPIQAYVGVGDGETRSQVSFSYRGHTNIMVYVPIPEQQFDFILFSTDGKEIQKKSEYKFGQQLQPDKPLSNGDYRGIDDYSDGFTDNIYERRLDFKNGNHSHFWRFDILKFFRIKQPGEYRLQVQVRLFTKDTNGIFQPFILPPAATKVKILESDLAK